MSAERRTRGPSRRGVLGLGAALAARALGQDRGPRLPRHVTPDQAAAVARGLGWLAAAQASDGSFSTTTDGASYPVAMTGLAGMALLASGNTTSRGPWADTITRAARFLVRCSGEDGLLSVPNQDSGRPMHGHGFALLFLSTVYGMESDPAMRAELARVVRAAIRLTARGQSALGGWTYFPGGGDEGSVTVTQIQGLRAAHEAGFVVPAETVRDAIGYLERCRTSDGGIRYAYASEDTTELPITAAAVATLYNAGQYESDLAESCRDFVFRRMLDMPGLEVPGSEGHVYYTHLYAAQAFYQAGAAFWDRYFPRAAALLLAEQQDDGAWMGDGIGVVYGTAVASLVLQMPLQLLPIYQR